MFQEEIKALIIRAAGIRQSRRCERTIMYAEGLRSRLDQIKYCLGQIETLEGPVRGQTSSQEDPAIDDELRAEFYCDSFWTWVYSALDILGQIINQTENLGMDENKVNFNQVIKKLHTSSQSHPVLFHLDNMNKSHVRKWMVSYRNCANHRRPICIWHERHEQNITRAYQTSTGPVVQIVRYICDHSVALKPNPQRREELIPRCDRALKLFQKRLTPIIKNLLL